MNFVSANTELTDLKTFDVKNLIKDIKIDQNKNVRVNLSVRNANGKLGDFVVAVPHTFSYGIKKALAYQSEQPKGYEVTVLFGNKKKDEETNIETIAFSEEEEIFMNKMKEIIEHLKKWCVQSRMQLKKPSYNEGICSTLNKVFYVKLDEEGNPKKDCCPSFTAKAIAFKTKTKDSNGVELPWDEKSFDVKTKFYESTNEDLSDPNIITNIEDYDKCYTNCKMVVKFDSIYVGPAPYLQNKLLQCVFKKKEVGKHDFLETLLKKSSNSNVEAHEAIEKLNVSDSNNQVFQIDESTTEEELVDSEPESPPPTKSKKKVKA